MCVGFVSLLGNVLIGSQSGYRGVNITLESDVEVNDRTGVLSIIYFGEIIDCYIAERDPEDKTFPFCFFPFALRVNSKWISCEEPDD